MPIPTPDVSCPCGSQLTFAQCCDPFICGDKTPPTAEALMRSRYSAHTCGAVNYLIDSWWPEERARINQAEVKHWIDSSEWLKLSILDTKSGQADDNEGWVRFIAHYKQDGQLQQHGEYSYFRKLDGRWYFVSGEALADTPKKVGRNDPCPCGSGKKFKRCCAN